LYEPRELEQLRAQFAAGPLPVEAAVAHTATERSAGIDRDAAAGLREELATVRQHVAQLRAELDEATARIDHATEELRQLKAALGA
jgi:chromosome segregation ATPase